MTTDIAQRWQLLALVLVVGVLLYLLAPVLTPFAVAAMFAYLFNPVADRLEKLGLGRSVAVAIVFLALTLLLVLVLLLLIPFIEHQISRFILQLPHWVDWFRDNAAPWLRDKFGLEEDFLDTDKLTAVLQANWHTAGGIAATVVAQVSKSGFAIIVWIAHLIIIPIVFFYLLRDWDVLIVRIGELLPRSIAPTAARLAREVDATLSAFVRGQLSVMIALGALYAVGLWLVGIDVGPLIGMSAGLISFVPYLGAIFGMFAGVIAALMQYHDWLHIILVLAVFAVGHVLESYVLVPRLVGHRIGLHPVAVIFAILVGGELFGFFGVLLALPVASVAMVLLRYAHTRYRASALYGSTDDSANADSNPHFANVHMQNKSFMPMADVAIMSTGVTTSAEDVSGSAKKPRS